MTVSLPHPALLEPETELGRGEEEKAVECHEAHEEPEMPVQLVQREKATREGTGRTRTRTKTTVELEGLGIPAGPEAPVRLTEREEATREGTAMEVDPQDAEVPRAPV